MIASHHCAHLYPHVVLTLPEHFKYATASVEELDRMLAMVDFSDNINKWFGACVNPDLTPSQIKIMLSLLEVLEDYTLENPSIKVDSNIFKMIKFELVAHRNLPEELVQLFLDRGPGNYIHGWEEMTNLNNSITLNPTLTTDHIRYFFEKHVSPQASRDWGQPTVYSFGVLFMNLSYMGDSLFSELFFKLHGDIADNLKCGLLYQAMRAKYVPIDVCTHGIYWVLNLIQTKKYSEMHRIEIALMHLILDRKENSHASGNLRQIVFKATGDVDFVPKSAMDLFVF